jgi:hypothetical protein
MRQKKGTECEILIVSASQISAIGLSTFQRIFDELLPLR